AADGNGRNEVPVDSVAEGFVDADALHINREPLWGALQRRGGKAAIAQIRREFVALGVAYEHAGNTLLERLGHVGRIDAREVLGRERLHHGWDLVTVHASSSYRRGGDGLERGNLGRGGGGGGAGGGGRGAPRGGRGGRGPGGGAPPPSPNRRRARDGDGHLGQRFRHLAPGHVRQHQRAECDGLQQPVTSGAKPRRTSITPTTHNTRPHEYSQ